MAERTGLVFESAPQRVYWELTRACDLACRHCRAEAIRTQSPVALYRESPLFRALRDAGRFGGRCGRCEFREICGGSRARAYAASSDPLAEDPLCPYEPAGRPEAERAQEVA